MRLLLLLASMAFVTLTWAVEPNIISWATASEKDNFGFNIYRGLTEQGPFERINSDPVAGAGTTDIPQKYQFEDANIQAETVYWYYVEGVSMNGTRKRMTPIYPSTAKPESQP